MHNAPPVTYPLGRSHFQGVALLLCWLAGAGVLAFWWRVTAPVSDWRLWLALTTLLAAGLVAWMGWTNSPVGLLCWDGQDWRWESQGYQTGTPVRALGVALDLQRMLLLRLENHDRATLWLWAGRSAQPERWMDLRRAVHSARAARPALKSWDSAGSVASADFSADAPSSRAGS